MALIPNKDNYFDVNKFKEELISSITKSYINGGVNISDKYNKNYVEPNKQEIKNIVAITFDGIKGVTEEMSKLIRRAIQTSILQKESSQELQKRIDNIIKGNNPTRFKYEDRIKMIARTEKTRSQNAGALNTAAKIGAKAKYIDIVLDNRTSEVSKAMYNKYGSSDKAIPLDEEFSVIVNGKVYSGLYPPFMPNDRDMVLFTF